MLESRLTQVVLGVLQNTRMKRGMRACSVKLQLFETWTRLIIGEKGIKTGTSKKSSFFKQHLAMITSDYLSVSMRVTFCF